MYHRMLKLIYISTLGRTATPNALKSIRMENVCLNNANRVRMHSCGHVAACRCAVHEAEVFCY